MRICPQCGHRGAERACPKDGLPMVPTSQASQPGSGREDNSLIGCTFGDRYKVESLIGQGGMGWVFKASHLVMQQTVALKVMRQDVTRDVSSVKRFYQEARNCFVLKHHNTIKVHDFGVSDDGFPYIVMEYLDGQNLKQLVAEEKTLPPRRAIRIAVQVCKALDEAHDIGMVHRDLKPANIFLTEMHGEPDYVKVLDFGISKFVEGERLNTTVTRAGMIFGTPKYLSPEQIEEKPLDRGCDIYALGIILYEALTGAVPFDSPSTAGILTKHLQEPPAAIPESVGGRALPAPLRGLVLQMLAKSPAERPSSAREVADRLTAIMEGRELGPDDVADYRARRSASSPGTPHPQSTSPAGAPRAAAAPRAPRPSSPGGRPPRSVPPAAAGPRAPAPPGAAGPRAPATTPPRGPAPRGPGGRSAVLPAMDAPPSPRRAVAVPWKWIGLGVGLLTALVVIVLAVSGGSKRTTQPADASVAPAPVVPRPVVAPRPVEPAPERTAPPESVEPRRPADPPQPTIVPQSVQVLVDSVPSQATVREGATVLGKTPLAIEVGRLDARGLTIEKKGYVREARIIESADAPGVVVTLTRGALRKADPGHEDGADEGDADDRIPEGTTSPPGALPEPATESGKRANPSQ